MSVISFILLCLLVFDEFSLFCTFQSNTHGFSGSISSLLLPPPIVSPCFTRQYDKILFRTCFWCPKTNWVYIIPMAMRTEAVWTSIVIPANGVERRLVGSVVWIIVDIVEWMYEKYYVFLIKIWEFIIYSYNCILWTRSPFHRLRAYSFGKRFGFRKPLHESGSIDRLLLWRCNCDLGRWKLFLPCPVPLTTKPRPGRMPTERGGKSHFVPAVVEHSGSRGWRDAGQVRKPEAVFTRPEWRRGCRHDGLAYSVRARPEVNGLCRRGFDFN